MTSTPAPDVVQPLFEIGRNSLVGFAFGLPSTSRSHVGFAQLMYLADLSLATTLAEAHRGTIGTGQQAQRHSIEMLIYLVGVGALDISSEDVSRRARMHMQILGTRLRRLGLRTQILGKSVWFSSIFSPLDTPDAPPPREAAHPLLDRIDAECREDGFEFTLQHLAFGITIFHMIEFWMARAGAAGFETETGKLAQSMWRTICGMFGELLPFLSENEPVDSIEELLAQYFAIVKEPGIVEHLTHILNVHEESHRIAPTRYQRRQQLVQSERDGTN